ncbi:MAG: hypothetical protein JRG91_04780, partial [Deltaproteobacteria bacterium]|nr:hypothetical protein [Deltaproteobacteria bacterium]
VLRSEADAEDAVQEAMLSLLAAPHVLTTVEQLGAWLFTVVRRRAVDIIRKDSTRRLREQESGLDELFEGAPCSTGTAPGPLKRSPPDPPSVSGHRAGLR